MVRPSELWLLCSQRWLIVGYAHPTYSRLRCCTGTANRLIQVTKHKVCVPRRWVPSSSQALHRGVSASEGTVSTRAGPGIFGVLQPLSQPWQRRQHSIAPHWGPFNIPPSRASRSRRAGYPLRTSLLGHGALEDCASVSLSTTTTLLDVCAHLVGACIRVPPPSLSAIRSLLSSSYRSPSSVTLLSGRACA